VSFEIVFNEPAHTYQLEGILVPGTTTVTGMCPKPWLAAWAAKEVVAAIIENCNGHLTPELKKIVLDAKNAWRMKRDKAADSGTMAHAHIENYIKTKTPPFLYENKEVQNSVELFFTWLGANQIEWLESEIVVGSKIHMYAGKFDAVAKVNGKVTLIDFKTSSGIYDEHGIQLAGYQMAYEELGKSPAIEQRMILWLPKKGGKFEARIIETPLAEDKQCFLNLLGVYRYFRNRELEKK
jgi:hypothetical protein